MSEAAPVAPTARAILEIGRPVSVVRAHFFDIDHAIANQIHHGVKLAWAPAPAKSDSGAHSRPLPWRGGERGIRREMRVLDRPLIDDVVVESGSDGAWVMRFVEGINAGARFVARFEAIAGETREAGDTVELTRVELEAFAPPGGFSLGLGKLSPLGLEKMLQKMLQEQQRSIDGYAPGTGPSAVGKVLAALSDLTGPALALEDRERKALVALLLETACAVAIADQAADEEERAVLDEVARALVATELDEVARAKLVKSAQGAFEKEGVESRCEKLGARLKRVGHVELGLSIAVLVAEVSHGIDPPELAALQKIASAGGLPEAGLASIISRIDEEMADAAPSPRAKPAPAAPPMIPAPRQPPPLPPGARAKKPS